VRACAYCTRELHHPLVGPLVLANETLNLPDADRQRLAVFYAEPGSPAATGLKLLADLVSEGPGRASARAHVR
jgi:hypothetical protein